MPLTYSRDRVFEVFVASAMSPWHSDSPNTLEDRRVRVWPAANRFRRDFGGRVQLPIRSFVGDQDRRMWRLSAG